MVAERWRWVGERAILRAFDGDLREANASAQAVAAKLARLHPNKVEDVVLGARSVLLLLREDTDPAQEVRAVLEGEPRRPDVPDRPPAEITVRYGGEDGPDLGDVARATGLAEGEVVRRHAGGMYTVGFIGFSPGFAYLLGLPAELATPRLETPRTQIPAGSVAIGGAYTGVYPRATPGGWRLIGRTDVELFDLSKDPPALLSPGDGVRFVPE